jgi:hypothetical protein
MRKNISNSLLLLIILSVMISCKAKKEVVKVIEKPVPVVDNSSKTEKLAAIKKNQADFSSISIKSKASLNIDNNSNDVSMNIRIRKDQAIWISVTAIAGLEVARALITPDSVKILNRLENTYTKKPFSYIYEFTSRQINFGILQSLLVGNTIKEFVTESTILKMNGSQAKLSGIIQSLAYSMLINERNKVFETSLQDKQAGQFVQVVYADFISVSSQEIPQLVNIKSQAARKNIQLDMRYARVEINQNFEIPFSVPKRFSVKD